MVELVADQLPTIPSRTAPAGLSARMITGALTAVHPLVWPAEQRFGSLRELGSRHPRIGRWHFCPSHAGGVTEQFVYGDGQWLINQN